MAELLPPHIFELLIKNFSKRPEDRLTSVEIQLLRNFKDTLSSDAWDSAANAARAERRRRKKASGMESDTAPPSPLPAQRSTSDTFRTESSPSKVPVVTPFGQAKMTTALAAHFPSAAPIEPTKELKLVVAQTISEPESAKVPSSHTAESDKPVRSPAPSITQQRGDQAAKPPVAASIPPLPLSSMAPPLPLPSTAAAKTTTSASSKDTVTVKSGITMKDDFRVCFTEEGIHAATGAEGNGIIAEVWYQSTVELSNKELYITIQHPDASSVAIEIVLAGVAVMMGSAPSDSNKQSGRISPQCPSPFAFRIAQRVNGAVLARFAAGSWATLTNWYGQLSKVAHHQNKPNMQSFVRGTSLIASPPPVHTVVRVVPSETVGDAPGEKLVDSRFQQATAEPIAPPTVVIPSIASASSSSSLRAGINVDDVDGAAIQRRPRSPSFDAAEFSNESPPNAAVGSTDSPNDAIQHVVQATSTILPSSSSQAFPSAVDESVTQSSPEAGIDVTEAKPPTQFAQRLPMENAIGRISLENGQFVSENPKQVEEASQQQLDQAKRDTLAQQARSRPRITTDARPAPNARAYLPTASSVRKTTSPVAVSAASAGRAVTPNHVKPAPFHHPGNANATGLSPSAAKQSTTSSPKEELSPLHTSHQAVTSPPRRQKRISVDGSPASPSLHRHNSKLSFQTATAPRQPRKAASVSSASRSVASRSKSRQPAIPVPEKPVVGIRGFANEVKSKLTAAAGPPPPPLPRPRTSNFKTQHFSPSSKNPQHHPASAAASRAHRSRLHSDAGSSYQHLQQYDELLQPPSDLSLSASTRQAFDEAVSRFFVGDKHASDYRTYGAVVQHAQVPPAALFTSSMPLYDMKTPFQIHQTTPSRRHHPAADSRPVVESADSRPIVESALELVATLESQDRMSQFSSSGMSTPFFNRTTSNVSHVHPQQQHPQQQQQQMQQPQPVSKIAAAVSGLDDVIVSLSSLSRNKTAAATPRMPPRSYGISDLPPSATPTVPSAWPPLHTMQHSMHSYLPMQDLVFPQHASPFIVPPPSISSGSHAFASSPGVTVTASAASEEPGRVKDSLGMHLLRQSLSSLSQSVNALQAGPLFRGSNLRAGVTHHSVSHI